MEILGSVFLLLCAVSVAAAVWTSFSDGTTAKRLKSMGGSLRVGSSGDGSSLGDTSKSLLKRAPGPLGGQTAKIESPVEKLRRMRLVRAGYRGPSAPIFYAQIRAGLSISLPVLSWFSPLPDMVPPTYQFVVPLTAFAIGYVGPSRALDVVTARRQSSLNTDLPTALELMVVCIEAGLGLMQTLQRVSEEMGGGRNLLARELALLAVESRAGRSNAVALQGLSSRTGNQEISVLVAMLIQTERFGTSLADSLRIHCDTMRLRQLHMAEERAGKASVAMLFPTALILLAVAGLIMGLAYIKAMKLLG